MSGSGILHGVQAVCDYSVLLSISCRSLNDIKDREICCYSISCKERENIGESKKEMTVMQ